MTSYDAPLPADLCTLLDEAWAVRNRHWPTTITASFPVDTLPVSVTGHQCELSCAHCAGHYLRGMRPLAELSRVLATSILVSGGCDRSGKVPVGQYLEMLRPLLNGRRSNWHLGLVSDPDLAALQPLLDVVSFDFVGDDETIREVYGLDVSVDDYEKCFATLSRVTEVVPHITIGLHAGIICHEYAALERLTGYNFRSLVLLVLVPTPGTTYAAVEPPPVPDAVRVIATARQLFPTVALHLGCMRPRGQYGQTLDILAVRAGVNVIVNPGQSVWAAAAELGLTWQTNHECCVFASVAHA
mgnify:CR=1 FL=1